MSIEGHWTVRYASVAGANVQRESGGVVTLRAGQVLGGDTWTYYSGSYEQSSDSNLTLRLNVAVHYTEGGESILGGPLTPYTLVGRGEVTDDGHRIHASVHVEGLESATIVAILTKVAELR